MVAGETNPSTTVPVGHILARAAGTGRRPTLRIATATGTRTEDHRHKVGRHLLPVSQDSDPAGRHHLHHRDTTMGAGTAAAAAAAVAAAVVAIIATTRAMTGAQTGAITKARAGATIRARTRATRTDTRCHGRHRVPTARGPQASSRIGLHPRATAAKATDTEATGREGMAAHGATADSGSRVVCVRCTSRSDIYLGPNSIHMFHRGWDGLSKLFLVAIYSILFIRLGSIWVVTSTSPPCSM